jgi:predicted nucleic acid-binding Zn ribbon protein
VHTISATPATTRPTGIATGGHGCVICARPVPLGEASCVGDNAASCRPIIVGGKR